jgi:hypothetical protein
MSIFWNYLSANLQEMAQPIEKTLFTTILRILFGIFLLSRYHCNLMMRLRLCLP